MGVYGIWLHTWGDPLATSAPTKPRKAHRLTPREAYAQQIDLVESGKEITFELGPIYIKPFITVLRSTVYPEKGRKFIVFQEGRAADGTPNGKRGKFWDSNKSLEIAKWILEREGRPYSAYNPGETAS